MESAARKTVLRLLNSHRLMTVATNRQDGWPQATTVGFANDGLMLYFVCGAESQKAANIARDNRISLTIDSDTDDPAAITGLSMAALACAVSDPHEIERALGLIAEKFPEFKALAPPDLSQTRIVRVIPQIISILDYSKGFGHTQLERIGPADVRVGPYGGHVLEEHVARYETHAA